MRTEVGFEPHALGLSREGAADRFGTARDTEPRHYGEKREDDRPQGGGGTGEDTLPLRRKGIAARRRRVDRPRRAEPLPVARGVGSAGGVGVGARTDMCRTALVFRRAWVPCLGYEVSAEGDGWDGGLRRRRRRGGGS